MKIEQAKEPTNSICIKLLIFFWNPIRIKIEAGVIVIHHPLTSSKGRGQGTKIRVHKELSLTKASAKYFEKHIQIMQKTQLALTHTKKCSSRPQNFRRKDWTKAPTIKTDCLLDSTYSNQIWNEKPQGYVRVQISCLVYFVLEQVKYDNIEYQVNTCYTYSSKLLQTFKRILHSKMTALKNITNGQFQLNFDGEDKAPENYKFIRMPGGDIYQAIRQRDSSVNTNYYIQNIRTGSFSQISENYLLQSKSAKSRESSFTTNSFDTQMLVLRNSIETKLSKSISFFQGIFAGMALLFTITLNLSSSVSRELVRVEDQSIRVISLLTTLGSFFSAIRASDRYQFIKLRGTSSQIDQRYKCLVLSIIQMIFYTCSYIVYNIGHTFSVEYNISGTSYQKLSVLTTVYTVLCLIGWIVTNINTKKHDR